MIANESARILSKGKSIEYSKWGEYVQYTNNCLQQDFVSYENVLLACKKSHLSGKDSPVVFLYTDPENPFKVTGIQENEYWSFVMSAGQGVTYVPSYDDKSGILSWTASSTSPDIPPVKIKIEGPWQKGHGEESATLGDKNEADGKYSISGGKNSKTSGDYSVALGHGAKTLSEDEIALGRFNKSSHGTSFSIGNGTDNEHRSNVFEIKDNKLYFYGVGEYNGTNPDSAKDFVESIKDFAGNNINVTYSELKALRDAGELKPGSSYQITDFVTTSLQENTTSAEHPFDLIVTALDKHTLSERAKATLHEGDEYFTSHGANLAAWDIWYCLDNDTNRFAWAAPDDGIIQKYTLTAFNYTAEPVRKEENDIELNGVKYYSWELSSEFIGFFTDTLKLSDNTPVLYKEWVDFDAEGNDVYEMMVFESAFFKLINIQITPGRGIIYRMIDEFGNDLPYDFKNILYIKDNTHVKATVKYDWSVRSQDNIAELVYCKNRDILIRDHQLEKDTKYYMWRIFDTDGHAEGKCYTTVAYNWVGPDTTFYEYIPPTEEELKAALEAAALVEGIDAGIGGNKSTLGHFVKLNNFKVISVSSELMQYTFGNEYGTVEELSDYSLNTDEDRPTKNNIMKPLFKNGKYTLNNNIFAGASDNIFLSNCEGIDKSTLTYDSINNVKNTVETEFSKVFKGSEVLESTQMSFEDVMDTCLSSLNGGYGSGGESGEGLIVDIPTGKFQYSGKMITPMEVAFANAAGNKIITNDLSTVPEDYEPIGIVVIPASHDVYGTGECGVMSLYYMDPDNPDNGSNWGPFVYWGIASNTAIKDHRYVPIVGKDGEVFDNYSGFERYPYFPREYDHVDPNNSDYIKSLDGKSWHAKWESPYAPSPYNEDGSRNPLYYFSGPGINPLSDFDGKGNTEILIKSISDLSWKTSETIINSSYEFDYPAAACCWRYRTIGTKQGDWYLPGMGELGYIPVRQNSIISTLKVISEYFNNDYIYSIYGSLSSTEESSSYILRLVGNRCDDNYKTYADEVLAFTRIKPNK